MYLVVGTYQGSPSDRYLLAFPVLNVVELQLIEIVTKCTLCFRAEKRSAQASAHPSSQAQGGLFCVLTVFDQAVCVTRFDQSECVICRVIFALGKSCFQRYMW